MRSRYVVSLGAACALGLTGCHRGDETAAAPRIASLAPRVAASGVPVYLEISGTDLGASRRREPGRATVTLVRVRDLDGNAATAASRSESVTVFAGPSDTESIAAQVDLATLPPGVYALELERATGGRTRLEEALLVLPEPALTGIDDPLLCASASARAGVTGTDLPRVGDASPSLGLGSAWWQPMGVVRPLESRVVSGCRTVPFAPVDVALCTRIEGVLPADVDAGKGTLVLALPAPLGHVVLARDVLVERSWPYRSVFGASAAVDAPLALETRPPWEAGDLVLGEGRAPVARMGDAAIPVAASECTASGVGAFELCRKVTFTVPQGATPGTRELELTTASGCAGGASVVLVPKPVVTALEPAAVCANSSQSVTVRGRDFYEVREGVSGDRTLPVVRTCSPGSSEPTGGEVTLAWLRLPVGEHPISIVNASTPPVRSDPVTLTVTPGPPDVGDPSPRLVYGGATRQVFVPLSGVTGAVRAAAVRRQVAGAPAVSVPVEAVDGGALVTFPALDADADGYWTVEISDESPCTGTGLYGFWTRANPILISRDFELEADGVWTAAEVDGTAPPLRRLLGDGHPGSSVGASRDAAGPDFWFVLGAGYGDADLAALRFDLRRDGTGEPSAAPGVVLVASENPSAADFFLEYALAPPAPGVWTHFDVPLDSPAGWIRRDASGTRRAATRDDFRATLWQIRILGSWTTGAAQAALDNPTLELAR